MGRGVNGHLEAALCYRPRAVPLHPRSKRPCGKGWTTRTWTADELREHYARYPEANIGVRTGDRLGVLDVDPRAGGAESLAELEAEHGPLPATPSALTGGSDGGEHRYFRAPAGPLASRTIAPGLELKGDGRMVVAPPSIHPESGRTYEWHPEYPFDPQSIASLPRWVLRVAGGMSSNPAARRTAERTIDDPLLTIPAAEYVPALAGRAVDGRGYVRCPFHSAGEERTPSLYVLGPRPTLWRCFAESCGWGGDIYVLAGLLLGIEPPLRGLQWLFVSEQVGRFYEKRWGIEPGWGR